MKALLKCGIRPGMFSNERVVTVTLKDGGTDSYFVAEQYVQGDLVRVEVYENRNGVKWAILPTDHPYQPVPVREEDLVPITDGAVPA